MKVTVSRKAHFNAAHRLFNPAWSADKNEEGFGKFKSLNPTAENIAVVIFDLLRPHLNETLDLKITLYETPRNYVEYEG